MRQTGKWSKFHVVLMEKIIIEHYFNIIRGSSSIHLNLLLIVLQKSRDMFVTFSFLLRFKYLFPKISSWIKVDQLIENLGKELQNYLTFVQAFTEMKSCALEISLKLLYLLNDFFINCLQRAFSPTPTNFF